jgi:hypothetical protein
MATQPLTTPKQNQTVEDKIRQLRQLYADAPEVGRTALENLIEGGMKAALSSGQKTRLERASINGRIGLRQGKVSELTVILKLLPGGAERIRAVLDTGSTNADKIGTLHDMRYVLFDNDTKILFATTYDTEWDPYIDDFATKVPDDLDVVFSNCEGWPGIRSPGVKDWIVKHQIQALGWFVAHPDLTVAEAGRLKRIGKAFEELLDKVG